MLYIAPREECEADPKFSFFEGDRNRVRIAKIEIRINAKKHHPQTVL
jgi:hypothetical protein